MSKHRPRSGTRKKRLGRRLRWHRRREALATVRAFAAEEALADRPVVYRGPWAWVVAWWRGELH